MVSDQVLTGSADADNFNHIYNLDALNIAVCVVSSLPSGGCTFATTQHMSMLSQQQQQQLLEQQLQQQSQPISTPCQRLVSTTPFCSPTGHGIFGSNAAVSCFQAFLNITGISHGFRSQH